MPHQSLLREVTSVTVNATAVSLGVRAVECTTLGVTPGYLTGESWDQQGIETTMPNLPDLPLPSVRETNLVLRIAWAAPETVRLTIAPPEAPALQQPADWLGVVTEPRYAEVDPMIEETNEWLTAATERLRVRVCRRPFGLVLDDPQSGVVLLRTAERLRQVAGLPLAPAVLTEADSRTTLHCELAPSETVYGFGEQFSRMVKNGQRLTLRTEDALGTGTGMAYKPVPVWHSSTGYTALLNTGAVATADIGHSQPDVLGLVVEDSALDLYVTAGSSPKQRLSAYTELTGRAALPPLWAFGYWLGRCRYHSSREMLEIAERLRDQRVPCDVLHLDPDWLVTDRLNCDFIWNRDRFGDRAEFVAALRRLGLRLSMWELPYLDPASPRYAEAERNGYLVRHGDGGTAGITGTPTPDGRGRALLDFTNPEACQWWQDMHEEFFADGVAVFKTDFGEGLPPGAVFADGTPPAHVHNLYPLRYNAAVSEATARHTGRAPFVWGRSGWAGSHRYPGQWGGDAESTVAGMRASLRGGLSYGLSAPGFWSHDIGGFYGPELTAALYARWTQFGALSPLMRAHGLRPREPWAFGEWVLAIARDWIRLRYSLLPYLWQVAEESARCGWPMLRPLGFEFPDDELAWSRDDAFLLGSDLLVVPVFDDGEQPVRRSWYLPHGRWTDLNTGASYVGAGMHTETLPLERMPVLVREGAMIPRVEVDTDVRNTDKLVDRPWMLHCYAASPDVYRFLDFTGTWQSANIGEASESFDGWQVVHESVE